MTQVISAQHISKLYGDKAALDNVSLNVAKGSIVGLIGPNGAGKTTFLRAILGLAQVDGSLDVLGMNPNKDRAKLMEKVSFIADTAILPQWIKVRELVDFMNDTHSSFNMEKAMSFVEKTEIKLKSKVKTLSKGMTTQLHLAMVMAIESELLVLDEPTLGLDILYRKHFFNALLNDYYDEDKTIIITTHQVDEIEHLLTDVVFINHGKVMLDKTMDDIQESFVGVSVANRDVESLMHLKPIHIEKRMGQSSLIFENTPVQYLEEAGTVFTPSVSDIYVAKMQNGEGA